MPQQNQFDTYHGVDTEAREVSQDGESHAVQLGLDSQRECELEAIARSHNMRDSIEVV